MTVLLSRAYQTYAAGAIVTLPASTEAALLAQGFASVSAAQVTAGAQSQTQMRGTVAIAAAASSVVVTNPYVDTTSFVIAVISQSAADATLTSIVRVTPAAGSFTITGNAASTAAVTVNWAVLNNLATAPQN